MLKYYYKGEKINLDIDKTKVDIWTDSSFDSKTLSLNKKIISDKSDKRITISFKTVLSKDEFLSQVNSFLSIKGVKNYSFYFERENTESIPTSNIFYVKLKNESDFEILEKVAKQKNVTIKHKKCLYFITITVLLS